MSRSVVLGAGTGPTSATTVAAPRFRVIAGEVGFPTVAWRTTPDDQLSLVMISSASNGSRWSGVDLEPGTVLVYGPGAEHAATNHPGLGFVYVTVDLAHLEATAELLGVDISAPARGVVDALRPSPRDALLHRLCRHHVARACAGRGVAAGDGGEIVRVLAHLLSPDDRVRRVATDRAIDSRSVVHDCITYAESVGRVPSISELCVVGHVSERRLRSAFSSVFDLPPSQFFRKWALGEARRRLIDADGATEVTTVALDLGFDHLGRFAQHYRGTFDEVPSATLRRSRG